MFFQCRQEGRKNESLMKVIKKTYLGYSDRQPQPSREYLECYPSQKSKRLGWKWPGIINREFLQEREIDIYIERKLTLIVSRICLQR